MSQIPAIASGHLVAYPDMTAVMAMSAPSPLAIPYAVETFLPEVVKGVNGR
jgi:iron complex transport system substrate-binding protein